MRSNKGSKSRDIPQFSLVTCGAIVATMFAIAAHFASGGTAKAKSQNTDDWKAVEQALGKTGSIQPGEVYKVSLPRSDLKVTAGGVELRPALALGSWIAFKRFGEMTLVMGDLVLTEDEVTPVLTKLQEGGIETTALHNHVLHENPRIVYMHIHAMGEAVKIATSIHAALTLTRTPFTASPAAPQNQQIAIDIRQIDQIMGRSGKVNGGVYQFSIARAEKVMDREMELPAAMGLATAINFQSTGNGRAAITGDFVLIGSEVNPVIRALRDNGIEVTALHSHMLTESPRLFFMHFWANDDAIKLARGVRAALERMNLAK